MGVTESEVTPKVIALCVDALVIALVQRGLDAEPGDATVVAKNKAADPQADDPRALISPGLRQTVACRADDAGKLSWFWAWSGPTPDAPPELEYLGPAAQICATADRIANVLRLKDIGPEPVK